MVNLTIDGRAVTVPKGTLLVEAGKRVGIEIPTFCYHPKLDPAGVCRMCLVQIEKMPKPVTACTTPVAEGMVVHTQGEVVNALHKGVLEFLLINHPLDCPVCDKGGECDLQDLTFKHGPSTSRLIDGKVRKDKSVALGQFIVLDEERCILCRRCTRFDDEISCEGNLIIGERGHENVVTTNAGQPFNSYFSGNTIELCPVGALTSELYRFRARPWDLTKEPSVCTGCSVGCSIRLDYRHGKLLRVIAGDNPATDGGWICDRGRFNYQYVHAAPDRARVTTPLIREGDRFRPASWQEALMEAARRLRIAMADRGGDGVGLIGGGRLTNEEAYAFQKLGRAVIGTPHVDHRVAGQVVSSSAEFAGQMTDLDSASVILLVDLLPAERSPVLDLRVRRAIERRGARLVSIGPARPRYRARHASVATRPGETAAVLRATADALTRKAPPVDAAERVDADTIARLADLLRGAKRVVALWGGEDAAAGEALVVLLRALRAEQAAAHLLIPGEQNNSRGAEAMGVRPDLLPGYRPVADAAARAAAEAVWGGKLPNAPGMDTAQMLAAAADGRLAALIVAGANPALTFPDGGLARSALERVPLLIVSELFLTDTAAQADIVFPAAPFVAKFGTYTTLDGLVQDVTADMEPGGESLPDLVIFDALATALGGLLVRSEPELLSEMNKLAALPAAEPAAARRLPGAPWQALSAGPARPAARAPSSAVPARGGAELLLAPVERLYAGGGTARFDQAFNHVQPRSEAALHPGDAKQFAVSDGDLIELAGVQGAVHVAVRIDRHVVPGTVQVIRHLPEAPVNRLQQSGQPAARVRLRRVERVPAAEAARAADAAVGAVS